MTVLEMLKLAVRIIENGGEATLLMTHKKLPFGSQAIITSYELPFFEVPLISIDYKHPEDQ